jgi:hypothetical protein
MSDVLPLLRKRRVGEQRDDTESGPHHLRIEQIHSVSPHRVAQAFIYSGFGVA